MEMFHCVSSAPFRIPSLPCARIPMALYPYGIVRRFRKRLAGEEVLGNYTNARFEEWRRKKRVLYGHVPFYRIKTLSLNRAGYVNWMRLFG